MIHCRRCDHLSDGVIVEFTDWADNSHDRSPTLETYCRLACEACGSSKAERVPACQTCHAAIAVCDDHCKNCIVQMHLDNPGSFDPAQPCWVADEHWIEAANTIRFGNHGDPS
jgi:hypothetical protein